MYMRWRYTGTLQMYSLLKSPVLALAEPVERSSLALGPRPSTYSSEPPGTVTVMTWEPVSRSQMSTVSATEVGDVMAYLLSTLKASQPSGVGQRGSDGVM